MTSITNLVRRGGGSNRLTRNYHELLLQLHSPTSTSNPFTDSVKLDKSYSAVTYSTTTSWTTPGTYTWTVPAGVTKIQAEVAGAGGGGGGGVNVLGVGTIFMSGGNGGRGELISTVLEVIPLSTINIVVGKGGNEGSNSTKGNGAVAGNPGDNSSIATIVARGGGGGGRGYIWDGNGSAGSAGTSYGEGGLGGNGATKDNQPPTAGNNGWVKITL